jgi:hypothetical protein
MVAGGGQYARQENKLHHYALPFGLFTLTILAISLRRSESRVALFEAFYNYCFVPQHTFGKQLLTVRRDKHERFAYAASQAEDGEYDENDAA